MQSLDCRDDLRELQSQRGESLRLLGTDRVGGDGCGCGWDGVDARGGRELRALATCHCGDDATASGEGNPHPCGAVDPGGRRRALDDDVEHAQGACDPRHGHTSGDLVVEGALATLMSP